MKASLISEIFTTSKHVHLYHWFKTYEYEKFSWNNLYYWFY